MDSKVVILIRHSRSMGVRVGMGFGAHPIWRIWKFLRQGQSPSSLHGLKRFYNSARGYRDRAATVNGYGSPSHLTFKAYPQNFDLLKRFIVLGIVRTTSRGLSTAASLLGAIPPAPMADLARRAAKVEPLQKDSRLGIACPHGAVASSDPSRR